MVGRWFSAFALLCALGAAQASAATGWSSPVLVDEAPYIGGPSVAISPDGEHQAFLHLTSERLLLTTTRHGAVGPTQTVVLRPAILSENSWPIALIWGEENGLTAVWSEQGEDGYVLFESHSGPGGAMSEPIVLAEGHEGPEAVGSNDSGDVVVAWNERDYGGPDNEDRVHATVRPNSPGATFGPSVVVSGAPANVYDYSGLGADISADGQIVVAYQEPDQDVVAVQSDGEGGYGEPQPVFPYDSGSADLGVVLAGSDAFVMGSSVITAKALSADVWEEPQPLGATGQPIDGDGNDLGDAAFYWMFGSFHEARVAGVHRDAGEDRELEVEHLSSIPAEQHAEYRPRVDVAPDGTTGLVVGRASTLGGDLDTTVVRMRPRGGAFGPNAVLEPDLSWAHEIALAGGTAIAGWAFEIEEDKVLARYSGLDRRSPGFTGGTVTTAVGAPVNLCGTADDDWGPIGITWSAGGEGACVTRSYATPGQFVETATVTDSVGNTGTGSITVTVAGPDVDAPPGVVIGRLTRRRLRGTASDDRGVAKVEVALVRRGKRCKQLTSAKRRRFRRVTPRPCSPSRFLAAKGTTAWSLRLGRKLARGRYRIVARVTDSAGQTVLGARKFRVKRR